MRKKYYSTKEPKRFSNYVENLKSPSNPANTTKSGILRKIIPKTYKSSHPSTLISQARNLSLQVPKDPKFKRAAQEDSNQRLFRGSRKEFSVNLENNPIAKYERVQNPDNFTKQENYLQSTEDWKFKNYLEGLKFLRNCEVELEKNYQLVKSKDLPLEGTSLGLGLLFELQSELDALDQTKYSQLLKLKKEQVTEMLKGRTETMREILKVLRSKGCFDEAVVLELLWRTVIKTFDSCLKIHDHCINDAVEMIKYKLRDSVDSHRKEIDELSFQFKAYESEFQEKVRALETEIKALTEQNKELKQTVIEKDIKIAEYFEVDSKVETIKSMSNMLKELNKIVEETTTEHQIQSNAIAHFYVMMKVAKQLNPNLSN